MSQYFDQLPTGDYLLSLGLAVLILLAGWVLALIAGAVVRKGFERTGLDNRIAAALGRDGGAKSIAGLFGKSVFWIVMLFVVVAVLQTLNLSVVTEPINGMLQRVLGFLPNVVAAGLLIVVAWVVATVLRRLVAQLLSATRLDERLAQDAAVTDSDISLSATLSNVLYWFVLLIFLPAVLNALRLDGLLQPVQEMLTGLLAYVPNVLGALIIFGIGWLIARVLRSIVPDLLAGLGADKLGARAGIEKIGDQPLSAVIGTVIYVLVLIPVLISALQALEVEAISAPATQMLSSILSAIPALFGAMLILGITYFVARLVSTLVTSLLSAVGFDNVLSLVGIRREAKEGTSTPSEMVGFLVTVLLMLFAAIEAANMLGFEAVASLTTRFTAFAGQVALGIAILGVGLYLANIVKGIVSSTAGTQARGLGQFAWTAIVVLSAAMALRQMGLADDIVNMAFGIVLGAVAIAFAIAFGLGGRDEAAKQISKLTDSMKS